MSQSRWKSFAYGRADDNPSATPARDRAVSLIALGVVLLFLGGSIASDGSAVGVALAVIGGALLLVPVIAYGVRLGLRLDRE